MSSLQKRSVLVLKTKSLPQVSHTVGIIFSTFTRPEPQVGPASNNTELGRSHPAAWGKEVVCCWKVVITANQFSPIKQSSSVSTTETIDFFQTHPTDWDVAKVGKQRKSKSCIEIGVVGVLNSNHSNFLSLDQVDSYEDLLAISPLYFFLFLSHG